MDKHIFIIGLMGTGKTSVGKALSTRLGFLWTDTDQALEADWGYPVATFFQRYGEPAFRRAETVMLNQLAKRQMKSVITTGGGIILSADNCRCMRKHGLIINLTANEDELVRRLHQDESRPLLAGDVKQKVHQLMVDRAGKYDFADITIDTMAKSVDEVVEEAYSKLFNSSSGRSSYE